MRPPNRQNDDSKRKWRSDPPHLSATNPHRAEITQRPVDFQQMSESKVGRTHGTPVNRFQHARPSTRHLINFGLLVFMAGQALIIWAFFAGQFAAWSLGNLCSVIGLAISLTSVAHTLRLMQSRIDRLSTRLAATRSAKRRRIRPRTNQPASRG